MSNKPFDKRKEAIALSYNPNYQEAPTVVAKGTGKIAEKIIDTALEHEIPIQNDPTLVSLLSELNLNESIPEELYKAVAEVFSFIYKADKLAIQNHRKKTINTSTEYFD
ncbi:MAG: EscU/YscU/HrcU family type III secretion system export apparatus switch protein [Bacillota bacterium]|nr:EscU/YscU/HrcU family type III secretion system export apparatus switch protein [Bacillota bacterium]